MRCDFLQGPDADWTIDQNYSTRAAKIRNSHGLSQQLAGLFLAKGIHLPKMGCKKASVAKASSHGSDSEDSVPGTVQKSPDHTSQTSAGPKSKLTLAQGSDGKFRLKGTLAAELQETEAQAKKRSHGCSQLSEAAAPRPAKTKATKAVPDDASDSDKPQIPATPTPRSRKSRRAPDTVAPAQGSPSAPLSTEKQSNTLAHRFAKLGHPKKSKRMSHTEISERRTSRPGSCLDKGNGGSRSRSHSRGYSQSCSPKRSPSRSRSHSINESLPGSPRAHGPGPQVKSPGNSRVYGAYPKSKSKPSGSTAPQSTAAANTRKGSGHCYNSDSDLDYEESNYYRDDAMNNHEENAMNNDEENLTEDDRGWPINRSIDR